MSITIPADLLPCPVQIWDFYLLGMYFGLLDSSLRVKFLVFVFSSQATNKKIVKADVYVAGLWLALPLCLYTHICLLM